MGPKSLHQPRTFSTFGFGSNSNQFCERANRVSRRLSVLALGLASTIVLGATAYAEPMIEPQIRDIGREAAQPVASMGGPKSDALRHYALSENREGRDWVHVWLQGPVQRSAVEGLGGRVGTSAGGWMNVEMPAAALGGLAHLPGLERAQLAQGVTMQTDKSVPLIGAPVLWGGTPPNFPASGKTGRRVILGIVDSGIDLTNPDFKKIGTNNTRILWVWDQTDTRSPRPSFNYGTEFASTGIDSGKSYAYDSYIHGTFSAGAAAGNGQSTGNNKPRYTYVGAAPEADLIVVKMPVGSDGTVLDSKIIDGVNYVFQKAAALHQPAVVVLAAGKSSGPHDGSDPLDRAISALTGPGKIVCAAAGNEAGVSHHAEWTSTLSNQTGEITFNVPTYTAGAADVVNIEGWYDASANYVVDLVAPNGAVIGPLARGSSATSSDGATVVRNGQYTSDRGSYRVDIQLSGNYMTAPIASGTWRIRFTSLSVGSHRVDSWMTFLRGPQPTFVQGKTESRLVMSPATADSVIAVGAFVSRPTWTAVNGMTYMFPGAVDGALATFSSPGPRRDGAVCPQITAPGCGLAVTRSVGYHPSTSYYMPDSAHCMTSGTSMSAALTAGCIALLLQDNTTYGRAHVLSVIQTRAVVDSKTGAVPNAQWGYGKLKISPTVTAGVRDEPGAAFGLKLISSTFRSGPKRFQFSIPSSELQQSNAHVSFQIFDVVGRQVTTLPTEARPGLQQVQWDGTSIGGGRAGPGLYWARLEVGRAIASTKFITLY